MLSLQNIMKKFSPFVLLTSKMSCVEQWRFCGIWATRVFKILQHGTKWFARIIETGLRKQSKVQLFIPPFCFHIETT